MKWIKITDKKPENEKVGDIFKIGYEDSISSTVFKVIKHENKLYLTDFNEEHNYPLLSDPTIVDDEGYENIKWRYLDENELMAYL